MVHEKVKNQFYKQKESIQNKRENNETVNLKLMFAHLFKDKILHHKDSKALENMSGKLCMLGFMLESFKMTRQIPKQPGPNRIITLL